MELETGAKVSPPGTQHDETKAFSERLKAVREKDRAELAAALGFDSWDAALNSGIDKKLLDAGIEPSVGKPIIEDAVANHPDVIAARQIAAQAVKAQQDAELKLLNETYGLDLKDIDSLDAEVKGLMEKGVPLGRAYVAVHFNEISNKQNPDPVATAKVQRDQSLGHITAVPGGGAAAPTAARTVTQNDIDAVKRFMPNATQEQIAKFLAAHPEIKK